MDMAKKIIIVILLALLPTLFPGNLQSQITPIVYANPGSTYVQNFDSLPASGTFFLAGKGPHALQAAPFAQARTTGWFFVQTAGTANQAGFYVGAGTSTAHGMYSAGLMNSSERSLGSLSSSGGNYAFGVILSNQSGKLLNNVHIQTKIEQWRKGGSGKKNTWICKIKTGQWEGMDTSGWVNYPAGNFSSLLFSSGSSALNGNLPEHQQTLSFQLPQLKWKPGEQLLIAWLDPDEAGNDDLCAIDQFQFSASNQVSLPTLGMIRLDSITPYQAFLSCSVSPGGANTQAEWEWDTIPSFDFPGNLPAVPAYINEQEDILKIKGTLTQLTPGTKYFVRLTASNEIGTSVSQVFSCTTPNLPPLVFTLTPTLLGMQQMEVGIFYQLRGGDIPREIGVEWATNSDFANSFSITSDSPSAFIIKQIINQLPPATLLYVRAFAKHLAGISYGNTQTITTPTAVSNFRLTGKNPSNAASINFLLETAAPIQYLSANDFSVLSNQINNAKVEEIKGSGKNYSIVVNTGMGDGTIELQLNKENKCYPPIANTPLKASGICQIDKTPPEIKKIYYADKPYKIGDTIQLTTEIVPDTALLQLVNGQWSDMNFSSWKKINDSVYISSIRISEGVPDIPAIEPVIVQLEVIDLAGNRSEQFTDTIFYSNDRVDANPPRIKSVNLPKAGWYAIGDTLTWSITYSAPIVLEKNNRNPFLSIQIGATTKQATAYLIKENTLFFRYLVKQGDLDSIGISWKKNIVLNGSLLTDSAGNPIQIFWTETLRPPLIKIDGIAPAITQVLQPSAGWYRKSDWLYFTIVFNKPIQLKGDTADAQLELSIESTNQSAQLIKVTVNQLIFGYQVPEDCWDKKGVYPIGIKVKEPTIIADWVGNQAISGMNGFQQNTGIYLDGTAPQFVDSMPATLPFCNNDSFKIIQTALTFVDKEPNEKICIQIEKYTGEDSLLLESGEIKSTGSVLQAAIRVFSKNTSTPRIDTLVVSISDSFYRSTKLLYLQFYPTIKNNTIQPVPIQCAGEMIPPILASTPTGGNVPYQFHWEAANHPFDHFVRTGMKDTLPNLLLPPLPSPRWVRRKVMAGPCTHFSNPILIPVKGEGLWLGKYSSDWNQSANWCTEKIPTAATSLVIPGGTPFYPILQSNGICDSLQILTGAQLTISGELTLFGNLQTSVQAINAPKGTIRLQGKSTQSLSGLSFKHHALGNLLIQNPNGLNITDSLVINEQISMQQGHITTNAQLWMNAGAVVGPGADGTFMQGAIHARWMLPARKRQYLFTSHPFTSDMLLIQLANQVDITGNRNSDSLFAPTPLQLPSAFQLSSTPVDSGAYGELSWIPFTSVRGKDKNYWNPLQGIRWLYRGKKGMGLDDQTQWLQDDSYPLPQRELSFTGELNTGDQVMEFSDSVTGYRLIGNPYLCSIDMSTLQLSDSIAPFYWIWNPGQGRSGGFTCHLFSDGEVLPPFGAFLIRGQGNNSHQLLFSEKSKVTGTSIRPNNYLSEGLQQMTWQLFQDSILYDQLIIRENARASNGFDWLDGEKILNPSHNIYTKTYQGQALCLDYRRIDNRSYIPMEISNLPPGDYVLRLSNVTLKPATKLVLVDNYAKQQYPLLKDTLIPFSVTSDPLSTKQPRFLITSQDEIIIQRNPLDRQPLFIWPVPASDYIQIRSRVLPAGDITISIYDFAGNLIKRISRKVIANSILQVSVQDILPGVYTLEITQGNQYFRAAGKWIKQ